MPSALGIAFFHKHWGAYEANPLIESDPLKKARQLLASAGERRREKARRVDHGAAAEQDTVAVDDENAAVGEDQIGAEGGMHAILPLVGEC